MKTPSDRIKVIAERMADRGNEYLCDMGKPATKTWKDYFPQAIVAFLDEQAEINNFKI